MYFLEFGNFWIKLLTFFLREWETFPHALKLKGNIRVCWFCTAFLDSCYPNVNKSSDS